MASAFSSRPWNGSRANTPPKPNTPNKGAVHTGHPDATAPVKALHTLEVAPFPKPKPPVICFLQITIDVFIPVRIAIVVPKVMVVTVNSIP